MSTPILNRISKQSLRLLCLALMSISSVFVSCETKTYVYELNDGNVNPVDYGTKKQKSAEVFLNVLYANMFQTAMSPNDLVRCNNVITSIGDKQVAYETVISKFMNDPAVKLPTNEAMRKNIPVFIDETYRRFFVRHPTEAEKTYFVHFIESNPNITPEHVYYSFAISNEYYYY